MSIENKQLEIEEKNEVVAEDSQKEEVLLDVESERTFGKVFIRNDKNQYFESEEDVGKYQGYALSLSDTRMKFDDESNEELETINETSPVIPSPPQSILKPPVNQPPPKEKPPVVKYFLNQLKKVNNIIKGLLDDIEKPELKKWDGRNIKDKNHIHGNLNKLQKTKYLCGIPVKGKKPKPDSNCLVCQLITLRERIDEVIDQNLISGEKSDIQVFKNEQKFLKDQLEKLITRDSYIIDENKGDEKPLHSKNTEEIKDKKKLIIGPNGNGYDYQDTAKSPFQGGVVTNCLNDLVALFKSMNCLTYPGTFWQKSITEGKVKTKPAIRKKSRCCDRDYPHIHRRLEGVPVTIRLHPVGKI